MTAKNTQADLELKKGFAELQLKMQETAQKIQFANRQIGALEYQKQMSSLTKKGVSSMDPKTLHYEAVGRLFILKNTEDILKTLDQNIAQADEKIKNIDNSKKILEKSVKESENNMRELVQHYKNM